MFIDYLERFALLISKSEPCFLIYAQCQRFNTCLVSLLGLFFSLISTLHLKNAYTSMISIQIYRPKYKPPWNE